MQSARHRSVSTVAICSSTPLIRPRATVARMCERPRRRVLEPALAGATHLVDRLAMIVGERRHERLELGVGHRAQGTVEQRSAWRRFFI